jgi:hypothetical protein
MRAKREAPFKIRFPWINWIRTHLSVDYQMGFIHYSQVRGPGR